MKTRKRSGSRPRRGARPRGRPPAARRRGGAASSAPRRAPRGQIWKGSIGFGLVSIPVTLQSGENRRELGFTMLDRRNLSPVGYRKVNKSTGEEVPAREVVKGLEVGQDRYVVVEEADLRRASPERSQRIEIKAFIEEGSIPPAYFDRPYYLEPSPKSEKPYALLRDAMKRLGKVAVATVVLRAKQHLAAVIPSGRVLALELLRYPDELRDPDDIHAPPEDPGRLKLSGAELDMARQLVSQMSRPWRPEEFKDEYAEELRAFIERKARAGGIERGAAPAEPADAAPDADIMSLLKKSLEKG
ncbi:MAG: Ku protein [Elusimicrobia bacterium]|nr:Ku protein [Elusimicrobiota bacterium]